MNIGTEPTEPLRLLSSQKAHAEYQSHLELHRTFECDCACPMPIAFVQKLVDSGLDPLFVLPPGCVTIPLNEKYSVVHSPYSTGGVVVLDVEGLERFQQFSREPMPLTTDFDRELAEYNLLVPLGSSPEFSEDAHHTLTAWMHVTNACNLDCPYCYVRKSYAHMDEAIGERAVERLVSEAVEHQFSVLKLKYAGGEASLHYRLVQHLHRQATRLTNQSGLQLHEVVLSNGVYFRTEFADWLADSGVDLMVSLDGIGDKHNRQRYMKSGKGSFHLVEHTIDKVVIPRGIRPVICVTVTGLNADGVGDLMKWILERELPFSLNFYRENQQSKSRTDLQLEERAIIDGLTSAYRVIEDLLPIRPFFNSLLDKVQGQPHSHTCGVAKDYLVISHEGKVAQCHMHPEQAETDVWGERTLLSAIGSGPIKNLSVDEKEGCCECSFRYLCTGGCAIETFRATGRWDIQSPNCNIYKTLLPKALRLEGLRVLKVTGSGIGKGDESCFICENH